MANRITKSESILNDAHDRVMAARHNVEVSEGVLNQAQAVLRAHQDAYDALEKALTPKPRKKSEKVAPAQKQLPTNKEPSDPICGVCGNGEQYVDHFPPSPSYHAFEAPKTTKKARAANAEK